MENEKQRVQKSPKFATPSADQRRYRRLQGKQQLDLEVAIEIAKRRSELTE